MKQRIPKAIYSKELREQAVRLAADEGLNPQEVTKRPSLPPSTHGNWLRAAKNGKLSEIGKSQRPLTEVELELARTKRELAEVKMERDLLKKLIQIAEARIAPLPAAIEYLKLSQVDLFGKALRSKLLGKDSSLAKEYLQRMTDEIVVNDSEAVIKGSYAALANAQNENGHL